MDSLPTDDETAEEYGRRIRRARWRRRLIGFGIAVACIGALGVYAALTTKPLAKIGETCGGTDHIACAGNAWCSLDAGDSGRCLQGCAPRIDDHCPAGTTCSLFDTIGKSGEWSGRTFACQPKR